MPTMHDPGHLGESLRDALEAEGWTVTATATKLGCTRRTLSRVLNDRTGISPAMALEGMDWSNAVFWVRRQAQYPSARTHTPATGGGLTQVDLTPHAGSVDRRS